MRRLTVIVALVAVIGTVTPVGFAQQATEMALGDWIGGAEAWGTARAQTEEGTLLWAAHITSRFQFTVGESDVSGNFDLTSKGLRGPTMTMQLQGGEADFTGDFNIDPGAGGTITGSRSQLTFGSGPITTSGVANVAGQSFEVNGQPATVSITNTIEYLACDHAIGNWDLSIAQQIQNEGWSPSWQGYWAATPVKDDLADELQQLLEDMHSLLDDFGSFYTSSNYGLDPLSADPAQLVSLAKRASELWNRLHNLTECDQQAIGADTIQQWSTVLTSAVYNLVTIADQYIEQAIDAQGDLDISYDSLNALISAAEITGAFGSGSSLGASNASAVESSLIRVTARTIESNLRRAEGLPGPGDSSCDAGCQQNHWQWAAGAAAEAATHGWEVTVFGNTYSGGEALGELVAQYQP